MRFHDGGKGMCKVRSSEHVKNASKDTGSMTDVLV